MEPHIEAHISEDDLELYALGRLRGSAAEQVEEHLLFCSHCQTELENWDEFVRAFRIAAPKVTAARKPQPPVWKEWLSRMRLEYAAPVLAMAAFGVMAFLPREYKEPGLASVSLISMRGEAETVPKVVAGNRLHLTLDARGLPEVPVYTVEIVDAKGTQLWTGQSKLAPNGIAVTTSIAVSAGQHWIRVYAADQLLREFGLLAEAPQ
ncbi:MAG: hypothetical protein FJW39_16685 [Acidobacteria bacterium]|nr:hypothetical protein [Acidobacteriota bacterium]